MIMGMVDMFDDGGVQGRTDFVCCRLMILDFHVEPGMNQA
jgi:hypothetical protein